MILVIRKSLSDTGFDNYGEARFPQVAGSAIVAESAARMMLTVEILQPFPGNVGIDLCRREIAMPQE